MTIRGRAGRAAIVGLVINLVGIALIQYWGGVDELQATTSSAAFTMKATELGNDVRLSSLADIAIFVPGYVLLFAGLFSLIGLTRRAGSTVRRLARIGFGLIVAGAMADQLENIALQLSLGTVDIDASDSADVVDPAGWLISLLRSAYLIKNTALIGAALLLLALALVLILASLAQRRAEA